MLIQEAARTPPDSSVHSMLVLQYVAALFLLIQLCNSIRVTLLFWFLGSALALLSLIWTNIINPYELQQVTIMNLGAYSTMLLVGAVANQNVRLIEEAKAEAAHAVASNIAHELRTPLAAIKMFASGANSHLLMLLKGYSLATESGLLPRTLKTSHVETLHGLYESIEKETSYSNTIIDMLLVKSGHSLPEENSYETFLASEVVKEAILRCPTNNDFERRIVTFRENSDFSLTAPRLLIVHVLVNLIKNGIYYSQKAVHPQVEVHVGVEGSDEHTIEVIDNGPGVPDKAKKLIFKRFYTTTKAGEGTGIGLSFCKMIMDGIGGSISVQTDSKFRTVFKLRFKKKLQDDRIESRGKQFPRNHQN
jgi:signal transduction histidine kinase